MAADKRPCGGCNRFRTGSRYDTTQCRFCWLFSHDAKYRALWAGEGDSNVPVAQVKPRMTISEIAAKKRH